VSHALRLSAVLLTATLLGAGPVRAEERPSDDPYGKILEEYRRKLRGATVERAASAIQLLDPANPRSLPELVKILASGHWFVRGTAVDALSTVPAGPLRSELRLHLITHEDPWVREGVAYAMATDPVPGDAEALVAAMDDESWRVRRTASRALGEIVSREGVERLVQCVETEQDLRVLVWARASLRAIAGTDMGRARGAWTAWWERHKDAPEWKRQGDEVTREEFAGIPLETVTLDVYPDSTSGGGGSDRERPELFVLAPFGYTHEWFRPYLDEAAQWVRITYVTLPTVQEVTGASGYGRSIPVYPVDKLAKALDALRKRHRKEHVVVMAAGPVAWIAERYALRYPKRVAGLVLVNGWLDRSAYAAALMRLDAEGTASERWATSLLLGEVEFDHTPAEGRRMRRIFLTHALNDRRDSEAWRLWKTAAREHGFVTVPPLDFTRHVKIEIPTLFTFPDDSPFGGGTPEDLRRIRASFRKPPPITAVMRDSRGLSHIEDPEEFLRVLRGYLRHADLID
jgi:pimeloyl-ACP methyl ester carboxylesterase